MNKIRNPIRDSSLVTVSVLDGKKRSSLTRIENIDSLLVDVILRFLEKFEYLSPINYQDVRLEERSTTALDFISIFRGFKPNFPLQDQLERNPASYFEKFFVVGEKGRAYREDVTVNRIKPYFDGPVEIEDVERLLCMVNHVLEKKDFGYIFFKELMVATKCDVQDAYMFLLNLSHNIGGRWDDKKRSPFVSAAYGGDGFDIALKFASSRNDSDFSYVIWGFIPESRQHDTILTKELTKDMKSLNAEWYEDIHSEIIIKDGIFPSNILGVFEIHKNTGRKKFIINPYLYQLFDIEKENSSEYIDELFQYVYTKGIPVDQQHFSEFALELGYVSRGLDKHDGKTRAGRIGSPADIILPKEYRFSYDNILQIK